MRIPYEHIDIGMRSLIHKLNSLNCLYTTGCCIGHNLKPEGHVIFKVTNKEKWHKIMLKLLKINNELKESNVNIYQWHRLTLEGDYIIDWIIEVQVHPRNNKALEDEIKRINRIKKETINIIINKIK